MVWNTKKIYWLPHRIEQHRKELVAKMEQGKMMTVDEAVVATSKARINAYMTKMFKEVERLVGVRCSVDQKITSDKADEVNSYVLNATKWIRKASKALEDIKD